MGATAQDEQDILPLTQEQKEKHLKLDKLFKVNQLKYYLELISLDISLF